MLYIVADEGHMNRIFLKVMTVAAAMSLIATTAQAEEALDAFSSRGHGLAFAVSNVCLPYLRQGGTIAALAGPSGVPAVFNGVPAVRLHGFGRVVVAADPATHGCTIVTHTGDGRTARAEALTALEGDVLLETLVGPNEAVLHSPQWTGLGEAYCFRLDEKVVEADIVSSRGQDPNDPNHADSLQLKLYWSDAEAVKKGVCRAR
jgi:hypothetical protein